MRRRHRSLCLVLLTMFMLGCDSPPTTIPLNNTWYYGATGPGQAVVQIDGDDVNTVTSPPDANGNVAIEVVGGVNLPAGTYTITVVWESTVAGVEPETIYEETFVFDEEDGAVPVDDPEEEEEAI